MRRLLCIVVLVGCDQDQTRSEPTVPVPKAECAVADVLARNCLKCHAADPQFGAPMSLADYAATQTPAASNAGMKVWERMRDRVHDDRRPMPPPPNERLNEADLATLDAWFAAGAPAFSLCETQQPTQTASTSCTPDVTVSPGTPVQVAPGTDELYCYGVSAKATQKRHITAFLPHLDNTKIVHHLSLIEADRALDSTAAPCPVDSGVISWRAVFGWTPGVTPLELPPEVGFPDDENTHWVVQIHYVNATPAMQTDRSGLSFCTTTSLRANEADIMAFGTQVFTIPPQQTLNLGCQVQVPYYAPTLHLFAAMPHMHQLGTAIAAQVAPSGGWGAPAEIARVSNWDFQNQSWLALDTALQPGDVVRTFCSWNNTTGDDVSFGPRTQDEMCYFIAMYYPRIDSAQWNWALPATYSACAVVP